MDKPHIVCWVASGGNGYLYFAGVVEKETPKRVTLSRGPRSYIEPRQIVARFTNEQEAAFLTQAIHGARGEYENRERRAREAYQRTVADLIERATK
jgi:hypothetical protein